MVFYLLKREGENIRKPLRGEDYRRGDKGRLKERG